MTIKANFSWRRRRLVWALALASVAGILMELAVPTGTSDPQRIQNVGNVLDSKAALRSFVSVAPAALPSGVELHSGPDCTYGYVCIYTDYDFKGVAYRVQKGTRLPRFSDFDFNDRMSSWINETDSDYCWYTDFSYSGAVNGMSASTRQTRVSDNDRASSLQPSFCAAGI